MSSSYSQVGGIMNDSQSEATIGTSTMTNDTFCDKSFLTDEQKKRKVEEMYSDSKFEHVNMG